MNWKLCITDPQVRALDFCRGSMDEGDGYGWGYGWGGDGDGDGDGYGNADGWGYGYGYGLGGCDGSSPPEWE